MRLRPLEADEFAALMAPFAPFERNPELAVAVSGGRDSLSLALLAHEWAQKRGGRVIGLIVDHALRDESAEEAQSTRELLRRQAIESEILRWSGAKPARGIQEAARAARYRLLLDACRRRGILHLLLAHHADDQAETIAMRAVRDSGPDGLAGMAALGEQAEARVLRPVLPVARSRLTATLEARGITWIEDPSNSDPRFERVRLRRDGAIRLPSSGEAGVERARRETALAKVAADLLEVDDPGGNVAVDRAAFNRLSREMRLGLLSRLVQAVGGGDYPPRRERLRTAAARLALTADRGRSGKSQDFTLSGCRLMLRQEPAGRRLRWIVAPENGRTYRNKALQPFMPAAFSACGRPQAPHLD
ncbi:MAG TPA: tRNA lysidine(34) synthetase TilS [Reyranella sp.]|nr:tRNA lysidine(34) synthetase TilS [Reyranella sp.]